MRDFGPRIGAALWNGWSAVALGLARRLGDYRAALSYYKRGMLAMAVGDYQYAILHARCAIAAEPRWWRGYHLLSYAYRNAGDTQRAKDAALQGLRVNPTAALLFSHLGDAEADFGCYAEAEAAFRRGLELLSEPVDDQTRFQTADMLARLGIVIRAQHRAKEAAEVLRESLALRPGDARTLVELGEAYKNQLDHDAAVRALLRAIEVDPSNAAAHYHLAENFVQLHRPLDARTYAAKAAALEPGNTHYRWVVELADELVSATRSGD